MSPVGEEGKLFLINVSAVFRAKQSLDQQFLAYLLPYPLSFSDLGILPPVKRLRTPDDKQQFGFNSTLWVEPKTLPTSSTGKRPISTP